MVALCLVADAAGTGSDADWAHDSIRFRGVILLQVSTERPTRSDPLQTVLMGACLQGRGACAEFTLELESAALIETNPTGAAHRR